jgi:arabinogalactan endo-1,4-beta-galactosidase
VSHGALVAGAAPQPAPFLIGGDVSMLARLEQGGVVFKGGGKAGDGIAVFRACGVNCFRLRLFVDPNGKDGVVNDLKYTLALAKRVKQSGAQFLLDFHYSDTWADPGNQQKPAAWAALSFEQLERKVEEYTAESLTAFQREGCSPDMVQIGNEIDPGMLWPDGKLHGKDAGGWDKFAALLRAGIRGARRATPDAPPRIVIHKTPGGGPQWTAKFFSELAARKVEFDVIGLSYYPWWHGSLDGLKSALAELAKRFDKDICVVETAYPWRTITIDPKWKDARMDWPTTKDGQKNFVADLVAAVRATPGNRGIGVLWWYPESVESRVPGGWFGGSNALFDEQGEALPAQSELQKIVEATPAQRKP